MWWGVLCCGVIEWCGVVRSDVAWWVWCYVEWCHVAWCGMAWSIVGWRGVVWRSVVWSDVA